MLTVVIVIHLMIVLAMIFVVLLQKSEGGGLGAGSAGAGFMTSRGTANVLTRTTAFLAIAFFVTSLALSWIASYERKPTSILNPGGAAPVTQPAAPAGPTAPLSQPGGGGLLNKLGGGTQEQQQQPAPPAGGPQVPQSQ